MRIAACITLGFFIAGGLVGCTASRLDQLRSKSDKVEGSMKREQRRVLALNPDIEDRRGRLTHLNELQFSLRAANVGLAAIPWMPFEQEKDRAIAFDVLDEVYDTIDWNIPLGPSDPKRAFPTQWDGASLKMR